MSWRRAAAVAAAAALLASSPARPAVTPADTVTVAPAGAPGPAGAAAPEDTSATPLLAAAADTALANALALLEQVRGRNAEGGFEYRASIMTYSQRGDSIVLRGDPAVVIQGEARLEAATLVYRRADRTVEARGEPDSSGQITGAPVLRRGGEVLSGARIVYDLEREQGQILSGRIERDKGFYTGARIRTVTPSEFHVASGSYTTCDYAHPHFDFFSPRIKVIADEMAVARPVYLRIYERRVLWVPFFVFSLRSDRQSGILTPSFGRRPISYGSGRTEWELRNLGYYFAPNDYWDMTLAGDLRQRSGWLARADLAYALRYRLNGSAALQYENRQGDAQVQRAWRLDVSHSQQLGDDAQLRASGAFQNNRTFAQDNANSLQDRLNRTMRSNLGYTRRWRGTGNSLSLSASHTRNLDTGSSDAVLPEISLVKARKALWAPPGARDSRTAPWYGQIYYNASARLRNRRYQTTGPAQTTTTGSATVSASSQHRPLPYLQLSPQLTETWQDDDLRAGTVRSRRSEAVGATASLSQPLYGMFPTSVWRLTAVRHELKPDLSFSLQATRADTGGILGFGGDAGAWRQQRQLSVRIDNSFWAKVDRDGQVAKVRLAQLQLSSGYDFDRPERPLSDLAAVLSAGAGGTVDSRLTMRAGFYDEADKLHLLSPGLRQVELNTSLRRAAARSARPVDIAGPSGTMPVERTVDEPGSRRFRANAAASGGSLSLTHYYVLTRSGSTSTTRSWLRGAAGFGLGTARYEHETRTRWRLDYSVNYDLHVPRAALVSADRITAELLSIQRDFHDWTARLQLAPASFRDEPAFYFSAQLRDIPQLRFERKDARL